MGVAMLREISQRDYYIAPKGHSPEGAMNNHRYYNAYGLGLDTWSFPCTLCVTPEVVKLYCSIQ